MNGIPDDVQGVLITLNEHGYEAYLVGGYVRDWLLGRPNADFDVTTNAVPEIVTTLFKKTLLTGVKHGTVTVKSGETWVEVTTYRTEGRYVDHRRPSTVSFVEDIQSDLGRRDFTINAMAMGIDGKIVDPYAGQADLQAGIIRAVGDARQRMAEDGLRILRAFRFATQLPFRIEEDTLRAMTDSSHLLSKLAYERVGQELQRILLHEWWRIVSLLATGPWLGQFADPLAKLQSGLQILAMKQICPFPAVHNIHREMDEPQVTICRSFALWCYAADIGPAQGAQMANMLSWPKHAGRLVADILSVLSQNLQAWSAETWAAQLYVLGKLPIEAACDILDYWEQRQDSHWYIVLRAYSRNQRIWALSDLNIRGEDVIQLGASGRTVGVVLRALAKRVLHGEVENKKSALIVESMRILRQTEG